MKDLADNENILSDIESAIQKLSVMISSAEEQFNLNKRVHLKIEHGPKASKLICKIDSCLGRETKSISNNFRGFTQEIVLADSGRRDSANCKIYV